MSDLSEDDIIRIVADKIERSFGHNCFDAKEREILRKNMEALRKIVEFHNSDEGRQMMQTLRSLNMVSQSAAQKLISALLYILLAGFVALISAGAWSNESIKSLVKNMLR